MIHYTGGLVLTHIIVDLEATCWEENKEMFAYQRSIRPCGMRRALHILDIPHEGMHHRALYDAKNIAKITMHILQ